MEAYTHSIYSHNYSSTLPSVEHLAPSAHTNSGPATSTLPSPTMNLYPRSSAGEPLAPSAVLPLPTSLGNTQAPTPAQSQSPVSQAVFPSVTIPSMSTNAANSLPTPTPTTASVSSSVSSLVHARDAGVTSWPAPSPREEYDGDNYSFQHQHHQQQQQQQQQHHQHHQHQQGLMSHSLPTPHSSHLHHGTSLAPLATSASSMTASSTATATTPQQSHPPSSLYTGTTATTTNGTPSPRDSWAPSSVASTAATTVYDRTKTSPLPSSATSAPRAEYAPRYPGSMYSGGSPSASSPIGGQRSAYSDDGLTGGLESGANGVTADGDDKDKVEEPYARLIYKAFMSVPDHALTLQEIYQWFRENTDKPRGGGKGWQNSIRHNLSMNGAFVKRDRKPGAPSPSGYTLPSTDSKKSTVWVLEDWAVQKGVQSTTRYRKESSSRRALPVSMAPAASLFSRMPSGSSNGMSSRALNGRKGGCATSNNARIRKREQYAVMSHRYAGYPATHSHTAPVPVHYPGSGSGATYGGAATGQQGPGGYFYGYDQAAQTQTRDYAGAGVVGGQPGMGLPHSLMSYGGYQSAGANSGHGFDYVGTEYPGGFGGEGASYY